MRLVAASLLGVILTASVSLVSTCECRSTTTSSVELQKDSFRLPVKLGDGKLLGVVDLRVGGAISVTVSKSGGLRLTSNCDCFPPCPPPLLQHGDIAFSGTATAFGVTALWEDVSSVCEPSITGSVGVSLMRTGGTGRVVDVSSRVSIAGLSFGSDSAEMQFKTNTVCECCEACPRGRFFPHAVALPAALGLIAGEPRELRILATDRDGDLSANGLVCTEPAGGLLVVTPQTAGASGERTEGVFTVYCDVPDAPPSGLRFVVWDRDGRSTEVNVPVGVWLGRPRIIVVEEATRWQGGDYIVTFRIEDPDFSAGDGCRELVTWNVVDVAGGSVAYGDPNQGIEKGCRSTTDTYCVVFTPDNKSPAGGQFTIEAVDRGGFSTRLTIPVSRPLAVGDDRFEDTEIARGLSAVVQGNLLANDSDPNTGSSRYMRVASRTAARFGELVVLEDGAFTYTPYSLAHNYVLEPEVFEYTATNGVLTSAPAPVTIIVHAKPEARPAEVTLFAECLQGPPCARATIEIVVNDADRVEGAGAYTFTAATYGGEGAAPAISFEGLEGRTSRESSVPTGRLVTRTVTAKLDRPLETPGSGDYTFTYLVTDPDGLSDVGTIVVYISTANQPPVGEATHMFDLVYNISFPEIYALDPIWYESGCLSYSDPERQPLRFRLTRFPTKGLVDLVPMFPSPKDPNGYSLQLLYRICHGEALAAHRGVAPYNDSFVVEARDPFGAAAITQVIIRVAVLNSDPVCVRDSAATPSSAAVSVAVLANDSDPEDDPLTVAAVSSAGHGAVVLGGGRASAALLCGTGGAFVSAPAVSHVTYTPARGFVGTDTFMYTVSDGYGGTATGTVTVEVTDAEPPVFAWAHPGSEPVGNDPGVCGAAVSWTPPIIGVDVTDNVGVASLNSTHSPGDVFPVGSTTVMYTAMDLAGNCATSSFDIVVEDRELPALVHVPEDILAAAAPGAMSKVVTWDPITAIDNCGVASVAAVPASGTAFPIGATKVIATTLDVHGNPAEQSFTVTVSGPLEITADDIEVLTKEDGKVVTFDALTEGGCPPVVVACEPESGSFFPLGTTTVDISAIDACGVHAEGSFTVTVTQTANDAPIARTDYAELGPHEILVSIPVLSNDEDPDGDRIHIVDIGTAACGQTYRNQAAPNEVIFEAIGCGDFFGSQVWFIYTVEDERGEQATAKVYVRIPEEGTLPRAPSGG